MSKLTPELLYLSIEKLIEYKEYINSYEEGISDDREKYESIKQDRDKITWLIDENIKNGAVTTNFLIYYTRFIKELHEAKLSNL